MASLPIINYPTSVLMHLAPPGGIYEAEHVIDRKKRMRALASPLSRVMCHHADANMLEIFPEWLADGGPGLVKHGRIRERMLKNPLFGVQMLLRAYDETFPLLERSVLASGEAAVPLLTAIDEHRIRPDKKRETYEHPLLDQPWWGLRYLASKPSEDREVTALRTAFSVKLKKLCADRLGNSAQATLVHLCLNTDIDPQPYAANLCTEPMVAYLASRLLCARGLDIAIESVKNLDARWAAHIALWGSFNGPCVDERIEAAIATHPAWAGEYIARSPDEQRRDWGWVKGLYERVELGFKQAPGDVVLWADLLWAMLDRICLQVEGKEAHITLAQSFERHQPPAPAKAIVQPSDGDSAFPED